MNRSIPLAVAAVMLAIPSRSPAAEADEPGLSTLARPAAQSKPTWHHAIKLDGGFGAATGFGGLNYIWAPVEVLNLEAGVGYGWSGVQISLMPKIAVGSRSDRYVLGVGLGLSIPVNEHVNGYVIHTPGLWLNADLLGYEHRFDCGLSLSLALGFFVGLAGERKDEREETEHTIAGYLFAQGRVSIAYWF